jgi:hypothetical protein
MRSLAFNGEGDADRQGERLAVGCSAVYYVMVSEAEPPLLFSSPIKPNLLLPCPKMDINKM